MARKGWWEWEDHLAEVLSAKPAEIVQEAVEVLEKHGCSVKELKSGLYYSSTLCLSMVTLQCHIRTVPYSILIHTSPHFQTYTSIYGAWSSL